MKILVAGASGFLGGYLVARLLEQGHEVRAVGGRPLLNTKGGGWSQLHPGSQNLQGDLRDRATAARVCRGMDRVFHMAAMIGGIGYLESRHADCTASVVVSSNLLEAAIDAGVERFLFPSSACVYPERDWPLSEAEAKPYAPRGGYGWEKLFTEQMCGFYSQQYGLQTRIARLGTVYGPLSPLGEAEKAPIAICRKVAASQGEIEIWGDGKQVRSFLYVDDAIDALTALMDSDYPGPVNIASAECVTVDQLVSVVEHVAGKRLKRRYVTGPTGVQRRVQDLALAREVLGWREQTSLQQGIHRTYHWVAALERVVSWERACA